MHINKIKTIRETLGYTQADLAEQSNLSIRTIQRLESGRSQPKGHTLKVLAEALNIEPMDLQVKDSRIDPIKIQDHAELKLKLLNLSALCFIGIPFGNLLIPFVIWSKHRNLPLVNEVGRKVLNFQIWWTLATVLILVLSPFLQSYLSINISLMLILGLGAVGFNLIFIFKTARSLMRKDYDIFPSKLQII